MASIPLIAVAISACDPSYHVIVQNRLSETALVGRVTLYAGEEMRNVVEIAPGESSFVASFGVASMGALLKLVLFDDACAVRDVLEFGEGDRMGAIVVVGKAGDLSMTPFNGNADSFDVQLTDRCQEELEAIESD